MKPNEQTLREALGRGGPFTIVAISGDRIKVRGRDWVFLPPLADEDGAELLDTERTDYFEVWGNGRSARWVAFDSVAILEIQAP